MQYILDSIEGDLAILEQSDGQAVQMVKVKASRVAKACAEGDVLYRKGTRWYKDEAATQQRRQEMRQKLNRLLSPKEAADE